MIRDSVLKDELLSLVREDLLEQFYALLLPFQGKTSLEYIASYYSRDRSATELDWSFRLYVLFIECFIGWVGEPVRTRYQQLVPKLPRPPVTVFFNCPLDLSRKVYGLPYENLMKVREDLPKVTSMRSNNISSVSVGLASDKSLLSSFEKLERIKQRFLNCLFDDGAAYKELIRLNTEYQNFYKEIYSEIGNFLSVNESSQDDEVVRICKDLKFSNIIASYLSKITSEMVSDKGVLRVRKNILAFFQAAYREYPAEYKRVVDDKEKLTRSSRPLTEIFVIKDKDNEQKMLEKIYEAPGPKGMMFGESPKKGTVDLGDMSFKEQQKSFRQRNTFIERNSSKGPLKPRELQKVMDKSYRGSRNARLSSDITAVMRIIDVYQRNLRADNYMQRIEENQHERLRNFANLVQRNGKVDAKMGERRERIGDSKKTFEHRYFIGMLTLKHKLSSK